MVVLIASRENNNAKWKVTYVSPDAKLQGKRKLISASAARVLTDKPVDFRFKVKSIGRFFDRRGIFRNSNIRDLEDGSSDYFSSVSTLEKSRLWAVSSLLVFTFVKATIARIFCQPYWLSSLNSPSVAGDVSSMYVRASSTGL